MNRYYLAADIGASSGRHILGRVENGKMKLREIYRFSNGVEVVGGALRWDSNGLFEKIKARMRECKRLGINPESTGIDIQAMDFVLLDKQGHVLGKMAGYGDRRTEGMDLKVYGRISREELSRRIDIQKQIFSTVYQPMAVREKKPDIFPKAEGFLMISDYLDFLLAGVKRQEYTSATTTQLINPPERTWDRELIETLRCPQKLSGGLSISGTMVGRLSEDVRKETDLDCRVVLPTTYDTGCAVAVVPSNHGHVLHISFGTWSLMGTGLKDANCRGVSMEANFTNENGYEYRYRFPKNITRLWTIRSVKREWKESGEGYSSGEIHERASHETISSIVDCNDNRFLASESMCDVVRAHCEESGQQVPEAKWGMVTVTHNNLADYYRICRREIQAPTDVHYDYIYITGGGASADYLNRLTAKTTEKIMYAGLMEATTIGNLAVQTIGGKEFGSLEEARDSTFCSLETKAYEPSEKVC